MAALGQLTASGITFDVYPQSEVKTPYVKFQIAGKEYLALLKARVQDGRNLFTWNKGTYAAAKPGTTPDVGKVKVGGAYWSIVKAAVPAPQPTPTPTPVPSPSGRPSAATTSPIVGATLTSAAKVLAMINEGQARLSGLLIVGQLDLRGEDGITFENCVFDAQDNAWCVRCDDAKTDPNARTFTRCEFKNMNSSAIYGAAWTASSCYVHHSAGDGFKPTHDVVIRGCYVTMLGMSDGAHADGVQIRGGSNIMISGNFFDMPTGVPGTSSNASLFLQLDSRNVTFAGNWCLGGNYTVAAYPDSHAAANVKITGNIFYPGSPRYGFGHIFDGVVWSNNVTDTGKVATPQMK